MSAGGVIAIAVAAVVVLGVVLFVTAARRSDVRGAGALSRETRRRDRESESADGRRGGATAVAEDRPITGREVERAAVRSRSTELVKVEPSMPPAPFVPPDPDVVGVSRRQFFNRATVALMSAGLGTFAAAGFVAFLWPIARGGFGGKVNAGKIDDIIVNIRANNGFFYLPEARTWITAYPADALPEARSVYPAPVYQGMEAGIVALYQKCPHLGCRVPECKSSQWFECPCHGSQYNRVGEKKGGPAPRGMDRFGVSVGASGDVTVDTGIVYPGPAIGTNTTGQEAEGPHCIGAGGGSH